MTSDRASRLKGLLWIGLFAAIGGLLALGTAPLARAVPWSWEVRLGRVLGPDLPPARCLQDAGAKALLGRMVGRLWPLRPGDEAYSIEVTVVADGSVNAFATLGGRILLHTGLFRHARSAEEIAGVLAHEIAHVEQRHIMVGLVTNLMTSQGVAIVLGGGSMTGELTAMLSRLRFSRNQETQADEGGLARLQAARIHNQGFRLFFERPARPGAATDYLSSHPSDRARIETIGRFTNPEVEPIMTPAEWQSLKAACSA